MLSLEWRPAARADLRSIVEFVADDNPVAALAMQDEIETKIKQLTENPRLYRVGRADGTREMVVRPNYIVVYVENASTVTILRVLHAAQQWP